MQKYEYFFELLPYFMLFNIIRCISLCKFALKLDEYLLLVHPNAHDGVDGYEEEGIGERG